MYDKTPYITQKTSVYTATNNKKKTFGHNESRIVSHHVLVRKVRSASISRDSDLTSSARRPVDTTHLSFGATDSVNRLESVTV